MNTSTDPVTDPSLDARRVAAKMLEAALFRRGGMDDPTIVQAQAGLSPQDRGFARALTMATLRDLGPIDLILQTRLQRTPPDAVVTLLRLGLAQILSMKVPEFAAVDSQVALAAEQNSTRPFKGLINAVLRQILRSGIEPPSAASRVPAWLYARWIAQWGETSALGVAQLVAEEPATDLSLKDEDLLPGLLIELEAERLGPLSLRTRRPGDVSRWPGYEQGQWWVQDFSAALPAGLLGAGPGLTALDMCAAPGGKTLQLAAAGATTTALDRPAPRLKRIRANLQRMGLEAECVMSPAETWTDPRRFDRVLLDAPCSATGTFRRHPDVLWTARPSDVASLAQVQSRLPDAAVARLSPGGILVYCVCSLEMEEGEAQVRAALQRHPSLALDPVGPDEGVPTVAIAKEGWVRILPHLIPGGADGFFMARFRAKA